MHPALHSWRDDLPATFVRMLAYVGGITVLSIGAAEIFQSAPVMPAINPVHQSEWTEIERPFPAFVLTIPEAADMPASYAIHRHAQGGRKDALSLGAPDSAAPFLQIEIYRPGNELPVFASAKDTIVADAQALGPADVQATEDLASKFGPLSIITFDTSKGTLRHCLGFVRSFDDPRVQLSGRFCQATTLGGAEFVERSTLACALDRLTLLAAGSEPKVSALFAQAELSRGFCGQRNPLLAPTPKHRALWRAVQR
ncbi:MAG: hypothetical protein ABI830_12185 [Pseudolabrys sp.]